MTEGKMRKTITAIASAATLLLVILLSVLIYQWITISAQKKRIAKAEENVAYWTEINKGHQDDLEFYESDIYKEWAAFKLGYEWEKSGK